VIFPELAWDETALIEKTLPPRTGDDRAILMAHLFRLLPSIGGPCDPLEYFILFESVASTTHGLEVAYVMVRWVACYHVVDSPVVTL
jgi:hypothetical protein